MRRFFDGGLPAAGDGAGEPPDRDRPPRVLLLLRRTRSGEEAWALGRRLGWADPHLGDLLVPADLERFRTDLVSVPSLFTWLVPRTGRHLPAALVHDALVDRGSPPSYVSVEGHVVDRVSADRVFRDAMADTGTGVVRRWLAWSAVTLATIVVPGGLAALPAAERWRHRVVAVATLAAVVWLGWSATWDLLDRTAPLAVPLPWMGEASTAVELVTGAAAAVVVPALLGLAWGRFRLAGVVLCVGLALLLHVTTALLVLTVAYRAVEALATRRPRVAAAAWWLLLAVATAVTLAAVLRAG